MKMDEMRKEYITEKQLQNSEYIIKECEEKLKKEQDTVRKKKMIEEIFVNLLDAKPFKMDGVWQVKVDIYREKEFVGGSYEISDIDRKDINFMSCFLSLCDIKNDISDGYRTLHLSFTTTLEERDQIEQFLVNNNEQQTLGKIKYNK